MNNEQHDLFYNLGDLKVMSGFQSDTLIDGQQKIKIYLDRHLKNVKIKNNKKDEDDSLYFTYTPLPIDQQELKQNVYGEESRSFSPNQPAFRVSQHIQYPEKEDAQQVDQLLERGTPVNFD